MSEQQTQRSKFKEIDLHGKNNTIRFSCFRNKWQVHLPYSYSNYKEWKV